MSKTQASSNTSINTKNGTSNLTQRFHVLRRILTPAEDHNQDEGGQRNPRASTQQGCHKQHQQIITSSPSIKTHSTTPKSNTLNQEQ